MLIDVLPRLCMVSIVVLSMVMTPEEFHAKGYLIFLPLPLTIFRSRPKGEWDISRVQSGFIVVQSFDRGRYLIAYTAFGSWHGRWYFCAYLLSQHSHP